MAKKKDLTILTQEQLNEKHELALANGDWINSFFINGDLQRDRWIPYRDLAGNVSTSLNNSYRNLRRNWNREFGIKNVESLKSDFDGQLLYTVAQRRATKAMKDGMDNNLLREDIRKATYQQFKLMGEIWKRK